MSICFFFTEVQIDEATVNGLVEMGFDREGCRKAVYHTKNTGLESAMNWVMEHMGDPGNDLNVSSPRLMKSVFRHNYVEYLNEHHVCLL